MASVLMNFLRLSYEGWWPSRMHHGAGDLLETARQTASASELDDPGDRREGQEQARAEPGREPWKPAETGFRDGDDRRDPSAARDEEAPNDSQVFERHVVRHDGAHLILPNGRRVKRRNRVHAASAFDGSSRSSKKSVKNP